MPAQAASTTPRVVARLPQRSEPATPGNTPLPGPGPDTATDTARAPARLERLDAIHQALWQQLAACTQQRGHPWRSPVLASVDAQGLPDARTVVLREVLPEARLLRLYTDARSPKMQQLQAQPRARLVFWSPGLGWQLRLQTYAQLITDGLAVTSRWATLRASPAARDYLSPLPPGAPVGDCPASPEGAPRMHFAVLELQVQHLDWLELHPQGHRRACFDAQGQGQWLTP